MSESYSAAIAAIAARAGGNGGEKLNDVIRALSASHSEAEQWHKEICASLKEHVDTERETLRGIDGMLSKLEGASLGVAQDIQDSLDAHTQAQLHMTHDEFQDFMNATAADRDEKTSAAIVAYRRRISDQKVWTTKRVLKYVGGVLVVVLTGLTITWGSAKIVENNGNTAVEENSTILKQLNANQQILIEHISIDNDREPTP